ncbi:MAG: glycerophosphodiester phosphodiesterase [Dehalococcoidia bacterium]
MQPDREPPQRIAHRAGNDRLALQQAVAASVDWIEVDVWWHHGRLLARHERTLWRLPIVYDKWRLQLALKTPLYLPELISACADGPRLLIDLKGESPRLPRAIVESLQYRAATDRAAICGQDWSLLDEAHRLQPDLRAFYSFGSARQVADLSRRTARQPPIRAASVAHALLTPKLIREFQDRAITVFAWTVNEPSRAGRLLELGVAGIISDRLDLLAGLTLAA